MQKYYQLPPSVLRTFPSKTIMPTCRNLMFICMQKKWTPFPTCYLRYCKDTANLLLWVLGECLIIPINEDRTEIEINWNQFVGNFDVHLHAKKINFIFNFFFEISQTYYYGNSENAWPSPSRSYYQFGSTFHAYLHAKNQLHYSLIFKSWDSNLPKKKCFIWFNESPLKVM